jgi:drug/metabolite transporter (DMT)-like permease
LKRAPGAESSVAAPALTDPPISRWVGIALLLLIAAVFGSNHVAARVAFDHGSNVTTAVAFRSTGTALFVLALLVLNGISLRIPGRTFAHSVVVGLLIAVQSYCLYSAVALIPVALALLAFQTFPMLLALISWTAGGERPTRRVLLAMPVALIGLALALDAWGKSGDIAGRWDELGAGVLWAMGASVSFALALYLITRWLGSMDGRLRSFLFMSVVAVVTLAGGTLAGGFALPADGTGWLALALLTVFYGAAITSMFVLLPRLGAVNNAAVLNFEPIAVLGLAWLILGQAVAPLQIAGAFIVVGAIAWMGSGKR